MSDAQRVRLMWTDGHSDIRQIDPTATEQKVFGDDGLYHTFRDAEREDAEGLDVWIEEPRAWLRRHHNRRKALVMQHADIYPGRYTATCPTPDAPGETHLNIPTLSDAQHLADELSDCPQPCDCPPWSEE